eukprot:TRINITY_DN15974_c0_g1_i1.p2 TRINITY_DN15974_c0_g1~~TRINITY_DN15974_c0_g1_i1.p2  ORF type:complete len:114 (+),score=23.89 TRINITY_DN15974_c0_g1_i1:49-390(+)
MFGRLLYTVIVSGTQVASRTIRIAWSDVLKKNAQRKIDLAKSGQAVKDGLTVDESMRILNLSEKPSLTEIQARYDKLYKINDPEKGGSFFLQTKIGNAKARLEKALKHNELEG